MASQLERQKTLNCDEVQGFLLGRPQTAEKFAALLGNRAAFA
jgi:EAL domain-containing protein (putative c-di-GMP-specific phosphodiesterase class I)